MAVQIKSSLFAPSSVAPEGQIHFVASTNFSDVNFFQNITNADSGYDFSNLEVYINGELTNQVANSISASANDDVIIRATDDHYPWFSGTSAGVMNYIKSVEEPFPLMHQANGNPITSFSRCFYQCSSLTSIVQGLFDNNTQVTDFTYCFHNCSSLTSIPERLFDKNTQVTDFGWCFQACSSLTSIPAGLFDKNTQVTNFNWCFRFCSKLTVNVQIGSMASSVNVNYFAYGTKSKGTVYCRAGSAAYNAFARSVSANVNVLTY